MERSITKFCPIIGVFCVFLASPGCANALSLHVGTVDVALQTSCDSEHKLNVQVGGTTYCAPLTETWADNSVHVAFNNKTYTVCNGECPTNAGGGDEVPEIPPEPIVMDDTCVWKQTNSNAYLLSDGNQYFDTGVTVNSRNNIEVTVQVINGSRARLFGTKGSSCNFDMTLNNAGSVTVYFGTGSFSTAYDLDDPYAKNVYKTTTSAVKQTYVNKFFWANDTKLNSSSKKVNDCSDDDHTMLVLNNDLTTIDQTLSGGIKLYNIKVYNPSGSLLHEYQPVAKGTNICGYTTPQNGMWDTVTKKFYLAGGSGVMGYGVDE